ncbi:MAG: AAA family ATPase, partial [Dehalococcoidia bacterium]
MSSQPQEAGHALEVYLLGRFQVAVRHTAIEEAEWRLRKAKHLVKLLALAPGYSLHREQVTELLWPDLEPEAAANNLHKVLHSARRTLVPSRDAAGPFLHLQQDLVTLRPQSSIWTDVAAFEEAAVAARGSRNLAGFRTALRLYGGDLLPEDRYEDWVAAKREALQELYLSLFMEQASLQEASGDAAGAVESFQRVTAKEPSHEAAHIGLIRLHAQAGHRHQALRQFHKLRQALKRELDAGPSPEAEQIYQAVLDGGLSSAPTAAIVPLEPSGPSRIQPSMPPLAGREGELEKLEDVLDSLFAGHGSLVLLSGEAGVGKSRLAKEVLHRAALRGARTLWGGAYDEETQLPYGPFVEALQGQHQESRALDLEEVLEAANVGPRSVSEEPNQDGEGQSVSAKRQRLFAAVANLLTSLTAQTPGVLVLDDLHAADEASLQLLHFLARATKDTSLLIVATFRPEDLERAAHLASFLAAAQRERLALRIDLQRLSPHESESLITSQLGADPIDRDVFETVYGFSEGNPFYTEEFVRSLRESEDLQLVDGRWQLRSAVATVPVPLAEVIAHRFRRLHAPTRQALNLMSAIGRETPYALLRATSPLSEAELLDALDDALLHRVIEESAEGYRFTHPLQRAVLYQEMGRARRASLHSNVARALEAVYGRRLDDHAAELAHHHALSDEPLRAVPHLRAAAKRAMAVFANEQAVRTYEQAIAIVEGSLQAGTAELASLQEEAGDVLQRIGELSRSEPLYAHAMGLLAAAGDEAGVGRLRAKAALSAITEGDVDQAGKLLRETLETMNEQWPQLVVTRTYYALAQLRWHSAQHKEALEAAELALLSANSSEDVHAKARAYEVMALACHSLGDWQKGIE